MKRQLAVLLMAAASTMWAQRITGNMRADIRGGGGDGKCTIEVWVDGTAEVEVRGRSAIIRTFSGQPSTFRRFQCNQEMPRNPNSFRFKGIDGRGSQNLVREPYGNGTVVVRIDDPKGGGEGYTFDLLWNGTGGYGSDYHSNGWGNSGGGWNNSGGGGGWNNSGGGWGNSGGGWNNSGGNSGSGWNDGWGSGQGWVEDGNFNFEGGRRGSGQYRDRSGSERRLDTLRMFIGRAGIMAVEFQSDRGKVGFLGKVTRRDGRRVYCEVRGAEAAAGASGTLEVEMRSGNQVSHIYMRDIDLRWSN